MMLYPIYASTLTSLANIIRSKLEVNDQFSCDDIIHIMEMLYPTSPSSCNYFLFENCLLNINENTYSLQTGEFYDTGSAFIRWTAITSKNILSCGRQLEAPFIKQIVNTFIDCPMLNKINFQYCSYISNAFNSCDLIEVSIPRCKIIGSYTFMNNLNLSHIILPNCVEIQYQAFKDCINLNTIEFNNNINFTNSCFQNCNSLTTMILRNNSIAGLGNIEYFSQTPFYNIDSVFENNPQIQVPLSLFRSYMSATNWVYYSKWITIINEYSNDELISYINQYKEELSASLIAHQFCTIIEAQRRTREWSTELIRLWSQYKDSLSSISGGDNNV